MNYPFNNILQNNISIKNELQVLNGLLKSACQHNKPIAIWKLPRQPALHCIISFDDNTFNDDLDLEDLKPGFIFNAFHYTGKKDYNFIPANIYYTSASSEIQITNSEVNIEEKELLLQSIEKNIASSESYHRSFHAVEDHFLRSTLREEYIRIVEQAIEAIHAGNADKIVPSRIKVLETPSINLIETFKKLCDTYQNSFISVVSIPGVGTWMGASPEILVSIDKQKQFHTVALAGTQANTEGTNPADVAWRQKEIEEQAMVSRYIINCFKKIRLREFDEVGPRTVVAGNLIHLKTDFKVDLIATGFPLLASTMLKLLHPTSAVCGMPKEPAMEFIMSQEKHPREFFSGYLGPVNMNDEIHIFVNLRCMQLFQNKIVLYAGAGVTGDSNPAKEWSETEIKCKTLLGVIDGL